MIALAGPFLIICTILGLGGLAKLWTPIPARRALRAVSVDVPLAAVRALGLAELALACAGIFSGAAIVPIVVGMAYVAFALFVVVMLRTADATSCGCFGNNSAPPSYLHVIVNLLSAAVAFGSTGFDGVVTTVGDRAGVGTALLLLVVVGVYALYLLLTALPVVLAPPQVQARAFSLVNPDGDV